MARLCSVCIHPNREEIEKALINNGTFRDIAGRFSVSRSALERHKNDHLPKALATTPAAVEVMVQAKAEADQARAVNVMNELQCAFQRVNLLFDACDAWLRDPDDPTKYDIGPRAEDIKVTYTYREMGGNGQYRTVRKKELLSTLLDQVNDYHEGELNFELVETKHADPRELVLKAAERLEGQLTLIARLIGELKDNQVNILINPEWINLRSRIVLALDTYPDARQAVLAALIDGTDGRKH